MTTMRDLCSDTRRQVYGALTDQMNVVTTSAAAGATELVLDMDITGITPGKTISSGLNVWYVKGTNPAAKTVFVIPGYDNSRKDAVVAGDFVYINPRVTDWYLFNQLNNEIRRMAAADFGLYAIKSWIDNVDPTWQTYTVPTANLDMTGLLRVRYLAPGTPDVWFDIPSRAYQVQSGPSGVTIRMTRHIPSGTKIEFVYKAPFAVAPLLTTDVVTGCGLAATMTDIPVLGASFRLIRTTESQRGQITSQGDSRRPTEVASMSNLQTSTALERDYEKRIHEEATRLLQRNPYRQEW